MYSHSRASANLSPIIQSPDHHSAPGNQVATPPPPPPPRRSPTPPTAAPPPLMTKRKPAPKRYAPQTKSLSHQPAKKKASSNPVIPQKLSFEKSEKELKAAVKKDVDSFFEKVKKQREERENPEKSYFYLPPDLLRKKVDQKKRESQKTRPKSDYDRSLTKSFDAVQKKTRPGKGVAQLGQQSQQSVPPLVIRNEYDTNLDLLDIDFEDLVRFYEDTGLDLA